MPFVTQQYLNYLESQLSGGGGSQGGIDIPPADTSPGVTTAPWANPAAGGPGSYPAPTPTGTPQTPNQWGTNTTFAPMPAAYGPAPGGPSPGPLNDQMPLPEAEPSPPPYVYNDPYGTGAPGNVTIPYPGGNVPYGGIPAPSGDLNAPPDTGIPAPSYANPPGAEPPGQPGQPQQAQAPQPPGSGGMPNVLGNFFRSLGALFPGDPGGFGEPMGFFGVQPQNPIGMFGVGGPNMPAGGGSYFGGHSSDPFGLPGSAFNLGASGGTIAGLGGKLAWHEAQPMFGGRTLAQVARENPELLPGLATMGQAPTGSGPWSGGGGKAPTSSV